MRLLFYIALILAVAVYGDLCLGIFTVFGVIGIEVGREEEAFRRNNNYPTIRKW